LAAIRRCGVAAHTGCGLTVGLPIFLDFRSKDWRNDEATF